MKFAVTFDVRKGNTATVMSATVEANSEPVAIKLAEAKLKSSYPLHRDYTFSAKRVNKK